MQKQPRPGGVSVNESIITLLLQLHSKYSGRGDSYVPIQERRDHTSTKEYRDSRVGDATFFIGKTLDRICQMDLACVKAVNDARQTLWPHYFARYIREALKKNPNNLGKSWMVFTYLHKFFIYV